MHAFFAVFYLFFLPVLSRPSFTTRTPNKDQETEQLKFLHRAVPELHAVQNSIKIDISQYKY